MANRNLRDLFTGYGNVSQLNERFTATEDQQVFALTMFKLDAEKPNFSVIAGGVTQMTAFLCDVNGDAITSGEASYVNTDQPVPEGTLVDVWNISNTTFNDVSKMYDEIEASVGLIPDPTTGSAGDRIQVNDTVDGYELVTDPEPDTVINKNYAYNGNFIEWQRKGAGATSYNNEFTADRMFMTVVQESVSHNNFVANGGLDYGIGYVGYHATINCQDSVSSRFTINQFLTAADMWGTSAKEMVFSVWLNGSNVLNNPSIEMIVSSANTPSDFTSTTTIATDNHVGVWDGQMRRYDLTFTNNNPGSVNGISLSINIKVDNTGTTPICTPSTFFKIGGLKVEEGDTPTTTLQEDVTLNRSRCERFYENGRAYLEAYGEASTGVSCTAKFKTRKNKVPTISIADSGSLGTSGVFVPLGESGDDFRVVSNKDGNTSQFYLSVFWTADAEPPFVI